MVKLNPAKSNVPPPVVERLPWTVSVETASVAVPLPEKVRFWYVKPTSNVGFELEYTTVEPALSVRVSQLVYVAPKVDPLATSVPVTLRTLEPPLPLIVNPPSLNVPDVMVSSSDIERLLAAVNVPEPASTNFRRVAVPETVFEPVPTYLKMSPFPVLPLMVPFALRKLVKDTN
jgi:hypothetical protein